MALSHGKTLLSLPLPTEAHGVAWSPNGATLAVNAWDLHFWDVTTGELARTIVPIWKDGHRESIYSIAWSPDGRQLALGGWWRVKLLDVATGAITKEAYAGGGVSFVAWSPDGRSFAYGYDDAPADDHPVEETSAIDVCAADAIEDTLIHLEHYVHLSDAAWSPTGECIASSPRNGPEAYLWQVKTAKLREILWRPEPPATSTCAIAWSPDGRLLATAQSYGIVEVWAIDESPAQGSKSLLTYRGHESDVLDVAWSPDGQRIATAGYDATVHVWDPTTGVVETIYREHTKRVEGVAWSPDGQRLASYGWDRFVKVWTP